MIFCRRTIQIASLNLFHSNLVHKFDERVAQNDMLVTQFENYQNQCMVDFQPVCCVVTQNEPLNVFDLADLVKINTHNSEI